MASSDDEPGFNSDGTQHESAGSLFSGDEEEESQQHAAQNVNAPRVFVDHRGPLHFHIRDLKTRERDAEAAKRLQNTLGQLVKHHGGKVVKRLHESNREVTVLVPDEADKQVYLMGLLLGEGKYFKHRILVEGTSFVRKCISSGMVLHDIPKRQGMGGQTKRIRIPFTDDDDDRLVWWMSRKIPTSEQGGRSGDNIFHELCNMSKTSFDEFEWVNRHTWQSWRNRYVKNKARFDGRIDLCAQEYPPNKYGIYHRDRRLSKRNLRDIGVGDDDDYPSNQEAARHAHRPRKRRRTLDNSPDDDPRAEVGSGANDKGKGKELIYIPSDEEDQLDQDDEFQFGNGNDPFALQAGPSGTRHTTPPEPQSSFGANITQDTLVPEPESSQHANRRRTLPVFGARRATEHHRNSEPRAPRRRPSQGTQQDDKAQRPLEEDDFDGPVVADLTPTPPPLSVPPSASAVVPVPPTPQPKPLPRRDQRKRRAALVHTNGRGDAPYRNTRFRSRSVEPQPQNKVRDTARPGQLGTVAEDEQEHDQEGEKNQQREQLSASAGNLASAPGTETYEDDNNVAQLLFEGISTRSDVAHASHGADGGEEQGVEDEDEEVEEVEEALQSQVMEPFEHESSDVESVPKEDSDLVSRGAAAGVVESAESFEPNSLFDEELASDDRETDRMLQSQLLPPPPSSSPSLSRASSILLSFKDEDPDEILRGYQGSVYSASSRQSQLAENRRMTMPQRPLALANSGPRTRSVPDIKSSPQNDGRTTNSSHARERQPQPSIMNQSYVRELSVSSVDSVPLSGTRASQAKRDWETKEKQSPYKPPSGTRAAKAAQYLS